MKIKQKVICTALAAASSIGTVFAADYTLRVAHQYPGSHHIAQALDGFAEEVETNSDGRVEVEIFGGAQLYGPTQFHSAVARGQIESAAIISLIWGGTIPEMQVFNIPYLLTDAEKLEAFPSSQAADLLNQKLKAKGVKNLSWKLDSNNLIFTSNNAPLVEPDDFSGIKIRGLSRIFDEGLIALGASPTSMPGSEAYQALQTGVVDSAITSIGAAYSRRYFEVQDYGTASNMIAVYSNLVINPQFWESLPQDLQEIVATAAQNAEKPLLPQDNSLDQQGIDTLEENGMEVTALSEAQEAAWKTIMQPAIQEAFLKSAPDGEQLIEILENL